MNSNFLIGVSYLFQCFLILTFTVSGSAADISYTKHNNPSYRITCVKALSASDTLVRTIRETPNTISFSNRYINAVLKNKDIEYKRQLLILAAHYGSTAIVNALINKLGVDPNSTDKFGNTALMRAATRKEYPVIRILVQHPRIDVNLKNSVGFTALMSAIEEDTISWAWEQVIPSTNTLLFEQMISKQFSRYEHQESVKYILSKLGVDIKTENIYGETALSLAKNSGDKTIKLLVKRYARKNNIILWVERTFPSYINPWSDPFSNNKTW